MTLSSEASQASSNRQNIQSIVPLEDFPILDQKVGEYPLVYLDNAATTHKPRVVVDALSHYYLYDNSNVHRGFHELSNRATDAYEKSRVTIAEFFGAESPDEIIFTKGTTEAINVLAHSWGLTTLGKRDIILLTEMEHHSNLVPWQIVAERTGATIRYVPILEGGTGLDLSEFESLLTEEVKLFAMSHLSNTLGTRNPVKELCAKARERGVLTLLDGAQSCGHTPVNVQEIGCDFYAASGHKMMAPTGTGILYGRREVLEKLPPFHGGGDMISKVTYEKSVWKDLPHKFEAGTPNIAGAVGLAAAATYLDKIGRDKVELHDRELGTYAAEKFRELEFIRVIGAEGERTGVVTFAMDGVHSHDVVTMADTRGVALRGGHHCNQPLMRKLGVPATARASFYVYNTSEEVDRCVEVLKYIHQFFNE